MLGAPSSAVSRARLLLAAHLSRRSIHSRQVARCERNMKRSTASCSAQVLLTVHTSVADDFDKSLVAWFHVCVVIFPGYLKSWAPVEMAECGNGNSGFGSGGEEETCSLSCLVAVGRALHDLAPQPDPVSISCPVTQKLQFFSRHANDGKYLFVDQRSVMKGVKNFFPVWPFPFEITGHLLLN